MNPIQTTQIVLQQAKNQALNDYRANGREPQIFFRAYTQALDDTLNTLWQVFFSGSRLCLLALGGFGRREMYPYSDVDLAIVSPDALSETEHNQIAGFVQTLWDMKLQPALKSGCLNELLQAAQSDLTAETAFLEARWICGNTELAEQTLMAFRQQMDTVRFMENKLLEMQQRHAKQGNLVLEPNLKNGVGGLRDVHTMMWLAQAQGIKPDFHALMRHRILTRTEANLLRSSHRRLARLRIELHCAAGREEDRLLFDFQAAVATQLGWDSMGKQAACETLMARFYRTAKTVMQLNGILLPMLRGRVYSPLPRVVHNIDDDYYQVNGLIAVRDLNLFQKQPYHLFKIIELLQKRPDLHGMAPKTLRQWWAASHQIDATFYADATNRMRFLGFFYTGHGLTRTMRFLNLYGVLARYLPEWHKIIGLLQHDLFHIYPVDDHILTVLHHVRRFAVEAHSHEMPFASSLMQDFNQAPILYLAALFHDIAKGRDGDHAILGVADARRFADDHRLPENEADLLCWLVEAHLLMSQTAQKEDIQDPDVVARFCQQVGTSERLTALYLLTVADIRGTNPKIWNTWKAQLLQTLYERATRHLTGYTSNREHKTFSRRQKAETFLQQQGINDKNIRRIFQYLGDAYFVQHNSNIIIWHLSHIMFQPEQAHIALMPLDNNTLQIMVYMPNQDRLFARLCRLIADCGLGIATARAFITEHDFILDTFVLTLPENSQPDEVNDVQAALLRDLQQFVQQPHDNLGKRPIKISRQARLQPISPFVRFQANEHEAQHYVLDIATADRPYLLADIAEVLARHKIRLRHAKIATMGERAEDSFIVEMSEWHAAKEYEVVQDLKAILS
ncbi:[protein-PII] uridylyltransferase [Alysiella sp.]|uniref:[protein-PII] uridylyltransferase n=1 Tax=Alysiella sp. TaxID=1872483 RepID=UPI0026DAC445|nr:[protein-PII] uridylyltransferase [Alysiella sp.]